MNSNPPIIAIIGPNVSACTPEIYKFGLALGERLVDQGCRIACGGMGGLMEAICKGAHASKAYQFGATIGILPGKGKADANPWVDVVIPTGIGIARNQIVVNTGDRVVAVAGGAGTLSEIAFAWQLKKPILCVEGLGGWSAKLVGEQLDPRRTDSIAGATSVEEVVGWIKE